MPIKSYLIKFRTEWLTHNVCDCGNNMVMTLASECKEPPRKSFRWNWMGGRVMVKWWCGLSYRTLVSKRYSSLLRFCFSSLLESVYFYRWMCVTWQIAVYWVAHRKALVTSHPAVYQKQTDEMANQLQTKSATWANIANAKFFTIFVTSTRSHCGKFLLTIALCSGWIQFCFRSLWVCYIHT